MAQHAETATNLTQATATTSSVAEPHHLDSVDPLLVAHFKAATLYRGFPIAFMTACREGIPARIFGGRVAMTPLKANGSHVAADTVENSRRLLELEQAEHEAAIESFRLEAAASALEDGARRKFFREQEAKVQQKLNRVLARIDDLPDEGSLDQPVHFATYGDLLHAAAERLASSGNLTTQRRKLALDTILTNFRIYQRKEDGQWMCSTHVRLAIPDGGVALLGPVEWQLGAGGKGTTTARARHTRSEETPRAELLRLFNTHTTLPRPRIMTILNAPFPELPHVCLNVFGDVPFPDWVGADWQKKELIDWIGRVYASEVFPWTARGHYLTTNYLRQLLATVAEREGSVTEKRILELVGSPMPRFTKWAAADHHGTPGRAWHRPVELDPDKGTYVNVKCDHCGKAAALVARIPEVPADLLCAHCRRMPHGAQNGMTSDVEFPQAYIDALSTSYEACLAEVKRHYSTSSWQPSELHRALLDNEGLLAAGVTSNSLAQVLGRDRRLVWHHLKSLCNRGVVERSTDAQSLWYLPGRNPENQDDGWMPTRFAPRDISSDEAAHRPAPGVVESGLNPHYERLGPFLDTKAVLRHTGWSPHTLRKSREADRVLGLQTPDKFWLYPAWQFSSGAATDERLLPALAVLNGVDAWSRAVWLLTAHHDLGGISPWRALQEGCSPMRVADLAEDLARSTKKPSTRRPARAQRR